MLESVAPHVTAPPHIARIAFWRACFLALTIQHDEAIRTLDEGLSRGASLPKGCRSTFRLCQV